MRWCYILLIAGLGSSCFTETHGARIFGFFYFQGKSHFLIFESLLKGLAERGHEVVVVSHYPQKNKINNYTDISIQGSLPPLLNGFSVDKVRNFHALNFFHFQWNENVEFCETVLNHPEVQKLINSDEKFDLVVTGLFGVDCWPGFAYKFKAPTIAIVSSVASPWANRRVGNPDNPSYIPNFFLSYRAPMDFRERLINSLTYLFTSWGQYYRAEQVTDRMLRKYFGEDMPPSSELINNISLVFINSHFSINQPRPAVPAFIEVGGLHIKPPQQLPKDIEEYINDAPHGVIYFSLGSMINGSTLPEEKCRAFLEAFRELPQRILWKMDGKVLKDIPANVKTSSWLPQIDVLNHPNVRAFISHGGLHSTEEAVYTGMPVIGMPFFFDQQQNIAGLASIGMAYPLDYDSLSKETVLTAVKTVLEDRSYRQNAERLSKLFRDRPQAPLETAIYWTEYVLRHKGAPHLRSAAIDMPPYQYLLLDVIAVLFLVTGGAFAIFLFAIKKIIALGKKKTRKEKDN
ncbi:UDP-glucosyltransferase 2 [Anabrus simplex]|uniref:UDP-glucosyltransferase 2 n=1 Tax=Anabrus simplex TaxID=316456 RepID=UPI0035A38450